ncbi:MAG: flagellar biosynthesis regulator FlaF [Thiobacillaceae bacterium]|jgi:flagellar protein FlaF|nr:flagellar biosynthesis regulator FlaF [Thiobacillaceae bacterium]
MPIQPLEAYQEVEKSSLSGRDLEASVLTKATQMLLQVQQNWGAPDRDQQLEEALLFNQRLWSLFQAEVSSPDNPLPPEIKTNILVLSSLVDKRIFDVIAYPDPAKLNLIININRNIAAGLRGDAG